MANKKHTRSSKRPLFIALLVFMLMMTIVFAFVGCNTRNKAEEQDNEQIDEIPEEEDPPLDEEEKEEDKKDEPKPEEEKKEEVAKPVSPPVAPKPSTPTVKPTAPSTPSKPVTPPANTAKYGSITIKKDGRYSETKTYDNVTIKADKVRLLNKTIKGDLIIDKSVDDDAVITLDNVEVMGEIIINGGYDFKLYNVEADMLKVKKKSGKVRLSAFDKTEIKDTETYRSIYLKEDDLSKGYDGFVNLTTKESNNIYIEVESFNCDLEGLYCNDITKVKGLDDSIYIDTVKAYDRVDLGSRVRVKTFTAYESGCTYVIEPNKIYTKGGAEEPERYKSKDKGGSSSGGSNKPSLEKLAKPTNVNVTFSGGTPTVTWDGVSGTSNYSVTYTIDGNTSSASVNNATSYALPKANNTQTVSAQVQAIGDGTNYKDSDVSSTATKTITKLATPTNVKVEFNAGVPTVSWDAVANAQNYSLTYTVNGKTENDIISSTSKVLPKAADNSTVKAQVKAIGNGSSYLDSEYGNAEATWTPTKTKLDTPSAPTVAITDSTVKFDWQTEPNLGKYVLEYKIGDASVVTANPTSNTHTITETVPNGTKVTARVKYLGNGTTYLDSEFSPDGEATSNVITTTQLDTPTGLGVTFNNSVNKFTASWNTVTNASSYTVKYTIGSGAEQTITSATNSCEIPEAINTDNTKIAVSVMAVGNVTNYTDSIYCEEATTTSSLQELDKPTINRTDNSLSFNCTNATNPTFEYTLTVGGTAQPTATDSSINLASYVGQQIAVTVVAQQTGKLDSVSSDIWKNTQLAKPTPTSATYSGTTLTLTFDANVLDTTNANYTVGVTDASSNTMLVSSPVTVSGDTITSPVTTNETNTLPDGTYNVTVTATANNISVYTSNGSKTITETYKLILPTAP